MLTFFIFVQAVQPQPLPQSQPAPPVATTLPDIQLDLRATARRVVIRNEGEVDLQLRTSLNGREGEGNLLEVDAPDLPQGSSELRNVEVRVRAEARIPPLAEPPVAQEPQPQR